MEEKNKFSRLKFLEKVSFHVTKAAGSNVAIIFGFAIVVLWVITGPFFNFSDHWLWGISITTSITTFLMVFVIQKSQNKDSLAIQLKLNELVAAHEFASNRLVDVEHMTEEELKIIQKYYSKLSVIAKKEENLLQSVSIDNEETHNLKQEMERELGEQINIVINDKTITNEL